MVGALIQLTTESLLAWVIVAIGVLGFIVAHTIERWYKAVLPAILALALIVFGLYCVITISHAEKPKPDADKTDEVDTAAGGSIEGLTDEAPAAVEQPPAENLAADLAATVPQIQNNPFYIRDDQSLKVTVRIRNNGRKPVNRVTAQCWVPRKSGRDGWLGQPELLTFDEPLQPGAERDVVLTVSGVTQPDDVALPMVKISEAF